MKKVQPESTAHWADRCAAEILRAGTATVISSGISPSGEIHIGNMREVLTADAIFRVLKERGHDVRFNYVADNFDPLRKVSPFLDAEVYERYVGCPLSEIPCPCGDHPSYADHFLLPFLDALNELHVHVEVERADQMYKSGRMTPWIVKALEKRDEIVAILPGKRNDEWSPFTPLCPQCGRMTGSRVSGFSAANSTVSYRCDCGSAGEVPMAGGGKLTWRVDWPARWCMLGVTVEPFGKDHATDGGSYDTGRRIVAEVFGGKPPYPIPYEWISLRQHGRQQGDMSSSRGNVLSIERMLEVVPPEVLRYMVLRERPTKTIGFDPGLPLLQLVDEFDDPEHKRRDARAVELSRAGSFEPVGVPFKHLVVVAQTVGFDPAKTLTTLHRNGFPELSKHAIALRLPHAQRWLEQFAPEDVRFTVQPELPEPARNLEEPQRRFLGRLAARLTEEMDGEQVHEAIYETVGTLDGTPPGELFKAIYLALLGKPRGPRAGWFIALLGPVNCKQRFEQAAGGLS